MDRSLEALKKHADEFMKRHWPENIADLLPKLPEEDRLRPELSDKYEMVGGVPGGNRPGVYAMLENGQVSYIGVGAAKVGGIYEGAGLGNRLSQYMRWDRDYPSEPMSHRRYRMIGGWEGVDAIHTIPFPQEMWYLACALESFLIQELQPPRNVVGKGRKTGN